MSKRQTFKALPSATSSLASADGVTHSDSPDGPMLDLFGLVHAPVSPSRAPGNKSAGVTIDISGRIGRGSSASVVLSRSLASRLKVRLPTAGSTLFSMTWSEKVTPAGRHLCRLRASARSISDNGCGSWPTPVANDDNKSPEAHLRMKARMGGNRTEITSLQVMAKTLASWPSPCTPNGGRSISIEKMDATGRTVDGKKHTASLEHAVKFATWPTARAGDGEKNSRSAEGAAREIARLGRPADLNQAATLVSWATPTTRDHKDGSAQSCQNVPVNALLGRQVTLSGSHAETAKPGQLNPAFSLWLMGYNHLWLLYAPLKKRQQKR